MKFEDLKSFPFLIFAVAGTSVLAFLLFYPLPFLADDYFLIYAAKQNPFPIFSDWIGGESGMYRPVIILSLAVQYFIHGNDPTGFYLLNYVIHILNSLLLYYVLKRVFTEHLDISDNYAFTAASVYFFLRMQGMTNIFWISGRTELFSAFFGLLAVYILTKKKAGIKEYTWSALLLLLSLLSKETGILFVPLIAGMIYLQTKEFTVSMFRQMLPMAFTLVLYILLREFALGQDFLKQFPEVRLFTKGYWTNGLGSLFYFTDLSEVNFFRKFYHVKGWIIAVFTLLLLAGSMLGLFYIIRRRRVILFSLLIMASVLGLVLYYNYYPNFRLSYIQSIPLIGAVVILLYSFPERLKKVFVYILLIAMTFSVYNEMLATEKIAKLDREAKELFMNTETGERDVYVMPALNHLSHKWSAILFEYTTTFWKEGIIDPFKTKNRFIRTHYYDSNAADSVIYNIHYTRIDSVTLVAEITNAMGRFKEYAENYAEVYHKDSTMVIKSSSVTNYRRNRSYGYKAEILFDYERVTRYSPMVYIGTRYGAKLVLLKDLLDGKVKI